VEYPQLIDRLARAVSEIHQLIRPMRGRMNQTSAVVHVNKIAAAGRQLDAAIRMFFSGEDELAVHTVASAAFRVLRDVAEKRGRNFTADVLRNGIIVLAKQYANGTLSEKSLKLVENTPLMEAIQKISDEIKASGGAFDPATISVPMTKISEQRAWPSKAANFLKHADRDVDKHLVLDEVDNEHLLIGSTVSYLQLMQTATPEMVAYLAFWSVKNDAEYDLSDVSDEGRQLAERLKDVGSRDRLALALEFIRNAKADEI
jgi:hypothetical protein